jgi:hypothetical protein
MENKRRAFRIEYKAKDMPTIEVNKKKYPILDISAVGAKIWSSNGFSEKQNLEGKIQLHIGEIDFIGDVIRINKAYNCTAIEFKDELPLGELIKERNYLKNEKGYKI